MTDLKQVWVIPGDPCDLAPLPALVDSASRFSHYDRKHKTFGGSILSLNVAYDTFDECRAAMIDERAKQLDQAREYARHLASTIEHIRTIPATSFPSDALQYSPQQQQEEAVQKKAQAEKVIKLANGSSIALKPSEDAGPLKAVQRLKRPPQRG